MRSMRIAASVGVLDEAEILEPSFDHLRSIGVDLIIVLDSGSTDGSLEILEQQADRGDVHIVRLSEEDADTDGSWAHVSIDIARRLQADWIFFQDADEFWLPATGSLHGIAALAMADVVTVPRYNVALGPAGPLLPAEFDLGDYSRIHVIREHQPKRRPEFQADPGLGWIQASIMPRVATRPEFAVRLHAGQHDVEVLAEAGARRLGALDAIVAHVPFTTWPRFRSKVDNIRRARERYPDFFLANAWHWTRWLELDDAGLLRTEFDSCTWDEDTVRRRLETGELITAAELLGLDAAQEAA